MKLPLIRQLVDFSQQRDSDYLEETVEVLESLCEVETLSDTELDVIGELLSNLSGALEVREMIDTGTPQKQAMNNFMQRVLGSIDR
jgi:hypothetical protein